jgi:hypothetical protein
MTVGGSGVGSASTATVSLKINSSSTRTCTYSSLAPGDPSGSPSQVCTFSVVYAGSIPAFLSLSLLIETEAGSAAGSLPLYDPASGSGLTFTVVDDQTPPVSYEIPTRATACPSTASANSTCYQLEDELVSASAFTPGQAVNFTLTPTFSPSAGNRYQGGRATLFFTSQAVQAPANPLPSACSALTAGKPCPANGSFSWS